MFKLSKDRQFKGNASNSTHDELQKNPNIFAELGGYLLGFQMTWWAPKGPKQVHSQDIEMANLKVFPSSPWVELNWNLQNFWTWWAPKGPKFSSFRIKVEQWDESLCLDNESRKQLIDKTVRVLPGLNPASKKKRLNGLFNDALWVDGHFSKTTLRWESKIMYSTNLNICRF